MRRRDVAAWAVLAAALTACSAPPAPLPPVPSPPATTAAAAGPCATPRAPLFPLPAWAPGEPVLAIPTPPGWAYTADHNDEHNRGTIFNKALKANEFITNAGVTLDSFTAADLTADLPTEPATGDLPSDLPQDDRTPDSALKYQRLLVERKVRTFEVDTTGTLCGFPSRTLAYTYEGRHTTSLLVSGQDLDGAVWIATVNLQTADPANPTYQRDSRTILDGFQFTLPE